MKFLYNNHEIYSSKVFLYQYTNTNFRIVCQKYSRDKGFEKTTKLNMYKQIEEFMGLSTEKITSNEEIERIDLLRTKRNIREIALCNNFTHFATITINSQYADRFHLQECQELLRKKLRRVKDQARRKDIDFGYIFITEKHKDGAFHFHGLVKGLEFYTNENGYLSNKVFDEIGFNSFSKIRDFEKTCNYITKYITKDCVRNENNQIYICSRGLKKADKYEINPINIKWGFENDFCKIRDFNINDLTDEEKLQFLQIKER